MGWGLSFVDTHRLRGVLEGTSSLGYSIQLKLVEQVFMEGYALFDLLDLGVDID